jgi:ribosomal protein S18 acetylase RimI-like enzyme
MSRFAVDQQFDRSASLNLYDRWLHNSLADPLVTVLVARAEGKPVGFVTLKQDGAMAQFVLLGVAPQVRGRGVGGTLMRAGIARCQAMSAERAEVVTQGRNVAAVRLYERSGFTLARSSYYFHKWFE